MATSQVIKNWRETPAMHDARAGASHPNRYLAGSTAGIFHDPSRIEGAFSLGQ